MWALVLGILSIVLVWPGGFLLGPSALALGLLALHRIGRAKGTLVGSGLAVAGLTMGTIVVGLYTLVIFLEVLSIFLTGSPVPLGD